MTMITCSGCGSEKCHAGQIEMAPEGGFDVVMPCSNCGAPNPVLHDEDAEMAQVLCDFFGDTHANG